MIVLTIAFFCFLLTRSVGYIRLLKRTDEWLPAVLPGAGAPGFPRFPLGVEALDEEEAAGSPSGPPAAAEAAAL